MPRLVVFGSINLDVVTRVEKLPLPGETVHGSSYDLLPGGKGANQALAAAQMPGREAAVAMIGAVGNDDFAPTATKNLSKADLSLELRRVEDAGTGLATIGVEASGENNIVVVGGANMKASADQLSAMGLASGDVLLTQHEVTLDEIWQSHEIAKAAGAFVVHNAAPASTIPETALRNIDYLIVNETEALALAPDHDDVIKAAEALTHQVDGTVILTLGGDGALFISKDATARYPVEAVEVVDTTGAGDAFCGAFAVSLAGGLSVDAAMKNAIQSGARACTHFGAQKSL